MFNQLLFFQGEFKSRRKPHPTALSPPRELPVFTEVDKMAYIWLTDYVFNTASLVYHEEGELQRTIRPEDVRKMSGIFRKKITIYMYLQCTGH